MIKIQIWDALCEMTYQTIRCKNYETSHILLVILKQITPLPPWAMLEEIFNCFSPSYDNSNIEIGGRGEIILLSQQFLHLIVDEVGQAISELSRELMANGIALFSYRVLK